MAGPRSSAFDWHWPHLFLLTLLPFVVAWTHASAVSPTATVSGWLLICILVLGFGEWWRPLRFDWAPSRQDLKRDGVIFSLSAIADGLAGALVGALAAAWSPAIVDWPWSVQFTVGALLAELGSYALHRASHRGGWLWRVHLLHHRPERINLANALTAHPLNVILDKLIRVLPWLLLGLSPTVIVALTLFFLTQSMVAHANIRGSLGWLDYLIGSAALHRRHHSTIAGEAGNFGTALPLWDQLFGTYRRGDPPVQVGLFDPRGYPSEHAVLALLAWPFARNGTNPPQ